jgi:hypothetical protein
MGGRAITLFEGRINSRADGGQRANRSLPDRRILAGICRINYKTGIIAALPGFPLVAQGG